eukprot:2215710-Pleurochrysis_carterae.AAC.3
MLLILSPRLQDLFRAGLSPSREARLRAIRAEHSLGSFSACLRQWRSRISLLCGLSFSLAASFVSLTAHQIGCQRVFATWRPLHGRRGCALHGRRGDALVGRRGRARRALRFDGHGQRPQKTSSVPKMLGLAPIHFVSFHRYRCLSFVPTRLPQSSTAHQDARESRRAC